MINYLIIIQARMRSTRLPGKVLKNILGKPMLWYVIKRLEEINHNVQIIIATGHLKANKPIVDFAKENEIHYYIGSENDVLDRYYKASKNFQGKNIIRITSDCPLIDPNLIDEMIDLYSESDFDYYSNVHPPSYPDGLDTEIFRFKALEIAWKKAILPSEREHVTPYIWKNNDNRFKIGNHENRVDLSNFRLTVDTPEDFKLLSNIIENFHDNWTDLKIYDVIKYLSKNKELLKINKEFERDEGYIKSLEEDKKFLKGEKK